MVDEPHIYRDNYMQAEVLVLANSQEEALRLLRQDDKWDIEELKRIQPRIIPLDQPRVVDKLIYFG